MMNGSDTERDSIREQAIDWLLKVETTPDDKTLEAALSAWCRQSEMHEDAYASVARMWRVAGHLPHDYAATMEPVSTTGPLPVTPPVQRPSRLSAASDSDAAFGRGAARRRIMVGAAAAAIAACFVVGLTPTLLLHAQSDYLTGVGEVRKAILDDGSTVHLDAESALAVQYAPARRAVRLLRGQAFFEVTPSSARPFTIVAGSLEIMVTGTRFSVGLGQDRVAVAVASGGVEVTPSPLRNRVVRLAAGDRLVMDLATGSIDESRLPPADIAAWRDGQLIVDGAPLADVVEQLARHHRGGILLADGALAQRRITGVFNLSNPIAALKAAAATQGAEVRELTPYLLWIRPG